MIPEVRELVNQTVKGEAVDKKVLLSVGRAFDFVLKKMDRKREKERVVLEIRGALAAIKTLESGEAESKEVAMELLKEMKDKIKKRLSKLAALKKAGEE